MLSAVQEFCRHVQFLNVIKDGVEIGLVDDWNLVNSSVIETIKIPYQLELRLGLSNKGLDFSASNGGFLITNNPEVIIPRLMPQNIGGEINYMSGMVDLNMARDAIIGNQFSLDVRGIMSNAIKRLLIQAVHKNDSKTSRILRDILMVYLLEAIEYEDASFEVAKPGRTVANLLRKLKGVTGSPVEPPPLTLTEASELLVDSWFVHLAGKNMSLRDALDVIHLTGKNRVYWHEYRLRQRLAEPIAIKFKECLVEHGFLVISDDQDDVMMRSARTFRTDHLEVLKYLSEKYDFDLLPIDAPSKEDVEQLCIPRKSLSLTLQQAVRDIEAVTDIQIRITRIKDAPPVFPLSGYHCLNMDNDLLAHVNSSVSQFSSEVLQAYIMGLLKIELA